MIQYKTFLIAQVLALRSQAPMRNGPTPEKAYFFQFFLLAYVLPFEFCRLPLSSLRLVASTHVFQVESYHDRFADTFHLLGFRVDHPLDEMKAFGSNFRNGGFVRQYDRMRKSALQNWLRYERPLCRSFPSPLPDIRMRNIQSSLSHRKKK